MRLTQRLGLTLRIVAGTAWASAMAIAGILVLCSPRELLGHLASIRWSVGVALAAGGLFVFMVLVADRWFRRADRPMIWTAELVCLGAFVGAPMVAVVRFILQTGE